MPAPFAVQGSGESHRKLGGATFLCHSDGVGALDAAKSLYVHTDGAERHSGALLNDLGYLRAALGNLPSHRAGIRITGIAALRPLLASTGAIGSLAAGVIGPDSRPVRAILFDKTANTNWALAWHQDRTICVRERIAVRGFGPWTVKSGLHHVAPPFDLLARMITLRVHLDDVPATNAPLLIAPASHAAGRVPAGSIAEAVRRFGVATCLANAGDVWVYSAPILHASRAASTPARRRVLQIDYAAEELPGGLAWLGV